MSMNSRTTRTKSEQRVALRNTAIFIVLVNGLAWLGPLLGGSPTMPGPGLLVWGTAPLVAAFVMRWLLRDPIPLGFKPALRGNGWWYAMSLLAYPLIIVVILGVGLWARLLTVHDLTLLTFGRAMAEPVVIYFIFALFEEVGWRGYLTPRVQTIRDDLWGYALIGVVWASWHFPYMRELWAHITEPMITWIPRFVLGTIIFAIFYGEIRIRAGSIWPAVLMHWAGNTIANTLLTGFVTLRPGAEWLISFGVSGALTMLVFGTIGGILYRRRTNSRPTIAAGIQPLAIDS